MLYLPCSLCSSIILSYTPYLSQTPLLSVSRKRRNCAPWKPSSEPWRASWQSSSAPSVVAPTSSSCSVGRSTSSTTTTDPSRRRGGGRVASPSSWITPRRIAPSCERMKTNTRLFSTGNAMISLFRIPRSCRSLRACSASVASSKPRWGVSLGGIPFGCVSLGCSVC